LAEKRKIVIAEDHAILRDGLRSLLESSENFEVVGEAADGLEAIRCVQSCKPDLILLDLAMPRMSGVSAIKDIKVRFPETKILAVTVHDSEDYVLEAFSWVQTGIAPKRPAILNFSWGYGVSYQENGILARKSQGRYWKDI
jgi:DNA-binding NarL/FixJ family response regulator